MSQTKHMSLEAAAGMVPDHAVLSLGGHGTSRLPMALVREIIRQGKTGLHLYGYRPGMDFDMLARAGCAARIDTPGMDSLDGIEGLQVVRIGEVAALARFKAAAADLPYALIKPETASVGHDGVRAIPDPFGGEPTQAVRRFSPDVAIIHAHCADIYGNVQMDMEAHADFARDLALAGAAARVIVSVEQIVSPQAVASAPWKTVLPGEMVDCVVAAPYGALPSGCAQRYSADAGGLSDYAEAARAADTFRQWLDRNIHAADGHAAYLDRLGMEHLQAVTTKRSAYA